MNGSLDDEGGSMTDEVNIVVAKGAAKLGSSWIIGKSIMTLGANTKGRLEKS